MKTYIRYANESFLEELKQDDISNLDSAKREDKRIKVTIRVENHALVTESQVLEILKGHSTTLQNEMINKIFEWDDEEEEERKYF